MLQHPTWMTVSSQLGGGREKAGYSPSTGAKSAGKSCLCAGLISAASASKHAEDQDPRSKAQKYTEGQETFRVFSLSSALQQLPVFQGRVAVEGRAGCESQGWYLFVAQRIGEKSVVDQIYSASSEMESFHFGTGGKKDISQYSFYAKDTWMYLSLCISGVGERIAFPVHNCFHF